MKPNIGVGMFAFEKVKLVLCCTTVDAHLLVVFKSSMIIPQGGCDFISFFLIPENYFQTAICANAGFLQLYLSCISVHFVEIINTLPIF